MNDLYKECINTANYIADKITDKTGYKAALKKIKESSDPDDFYILYKMTINGQDYKLYAGEEDFTIAGEDNEIYIESNGFNTNRNIEYFCERILDGVNEAMDFGKAKQILKENGYIVERLLDGPILDELGTDSIVKNIVDIIERVYPVQNYQGRDTQQTYTKAEYEIELENGRTFIVEFSKGQGFEYKGRNYPWKLIEENKGGYTTIAYNFDMLVKWTRKVRELG